jgi:hypothetical protein
LAFVKTQAKYSSAYSDGLLKTELNFRRERLPRRAKGGNGTGPWVVWGTSI